MPRHGVLALGTLGLVVVLAGPAAGEYKAAYATTSVRPVLSGDTVTIPIKVTNTGTAVWNHTGHCAVTLGYHWHDRQSRVASETQAAPLPDSVSPGQTVELAATVTAPSTPGTYTLVWDMRARCEWFTKLGAAAAPPQQVQVVPRR